MLTCAHCSYKTTRTFNMNRHIDSKHMPKKNIDIISNSKDTNNYNMEQNINIAEQNINMEEQNINM